MTIGARLTMAFASVTLIIGCGAAVTSWQFIGIRSQTTRLTRVDDQVLAIYRVRADVGAIRRRLETVSKTRDVSRFDSSADSLGRELFGDIKQSLRYFYETSTPVPGTLGALGDAISDQFDAMHRLADVNDWTAIQLRLDNQVDEILNSVREMVEHVDLDVSQRRIQIVREIESAQQRAQLILALTAFISLIASLALGLYVTRSIVRPLAQLKAAAHQFALGDFNIRLEAASNDELGDLGNAFMLAARKLRGYYSALERSNEDLERFAYAASHDLQEPLRTITSFSELLKRSCEDSLSSSGKEYLTYLANAAARMRELVTGILEYSRLARSDDYRQERVETEEIVTVVLKNLHATVEQTHAVVTHDALPTVTGSKLQLIQLFQNLIGNAIKYRRDQVPPRVHISAREDGASWRFCVEDNGMGIEPAYHAQIFGMFKQLGRGSRGGAGVGLAISKRIVEQHGGEISVASNPGEGSRFHFTLKPVGNNDRGDDL